ncbi:MAG: YihY/virulence factor BrkB family protein [Deltaproteobacteria bacterium]|nr:YihY/virulence factor BrkB family protein [Deltaproteobacteria bacterium]
MSSIMILRRPLRRSRSPRLRMPTIPPRWQGSYRRDDHTRVPGEPLAPETRRLSLELLVSAYRRLSADNGDGLAASLAFGAVLSLAPLFLVVLAVASLVLDEGEARGHLVSLVRDMLGSRAVPMLERWIDDARAWSAGATVLGVVLFVLGSSRLVGFVDAAFQTIFDAPPLPPEGFVQAARRFLKTQLRSVLVTLGAGALMVLSILVRVMGGWFVEAGASPALHSLWPLIRELGSFTVWTCALLFIYRVLPPVRLERGDVWVGALVSATLVSVTLLVLRTAAMHLDFGAAYGAAGALVGTVLTLYVVSQLFLFGAEITAELAARRGLPVRAAADGAPARVCLPKPERDLSATRVA